MIKMQLWSEKYKPKVIEGIVGQKKAILEVLSLLEKWKPGKALFFYGSAGVGKTLLVEVLASQKEFALLQLNASDQRNAEAIETLLGETSKEKPLFHKGKIILLDECLDFNSVVTIRNNNKVKNLKLGKLVENIHKNDCIKVLSLDSRNNEVFVDIKQVIKLPYNSSKEFYTIKLHDGKKILATGNHLFLTPQGWKTAWELNRGKLLLARLPSLKEPRERNLNKVVDIEIKTLPRNKLRPMFSELKIVKVLAKHLKGLKIKEITKLTDLRRQIVSPILSENSKCYVSLIKLNIAKRQKVGKYSISTLLIPRNKAIKILKQEKERIREKKFKIKMINKLKKLGLIPLKKKEAIISAKLTGHIFGDGSFTFTTKTKSAFFSGKREDMKRIKLDIKKLGFYTCGKIRCTKWKEGKVWSITSNDIAFLTLLHSLDVPIGKKTDNEYLIPKWILNSDKDIKRAFLAAFFGSEGFKPMFQKESVKPIGIYQRKREDLRNNLKEFLTLISNLLLEFNVKSKVKIKPNSKVKRRDGSITIKGELILSNSMKNTINFLKNIGYEYCEYKRNIARKALKYLIWRHSIGKNAHSFSRIPYFREWLDSSNKNNFAYYYIDSIKKSNDPKWVYCLTTENGNFIANGIVVHNCDGISGRDKGAVTAIIKLIKSSRFPVVLCANDPWQLKLRPLRNYCKLIKFTKIPSPSIAKFLKGICAKEKIEVKDDVLKDLARWSQGDLRSAVNDLQLITSGKKVIKSEDLEVLGYREREKSIFNILPTIFGSKSINVAKRAMAEADKDPDEIFWWIETNLAAVFKTPDAIAKGYDLLSKADIFRAMVRKQQNWRFKRFMMDLLAGISLYKPETHGWVPYKPPQRLMRLGATKQKRAILNALCKKIGNRLHCSARIVKKDYLPYFRIMLKRKPEWSEGLELNEDELKLIKGVNL